MKADLKNKNSGNSIFQKNFWNYLTKPRFGIFKKFLFSFLLISIAPLLVFSFYTLMNISSVRNDIINHAKSDIDQKTKETMEVQAVLTAKAVERFLRQCENDLRVLKQSDFTPYDFLQFSRQHQSEIWIRKGTNKNPYEVHLQIPLYKEISFIDETGQEEIKIKTRDSLLKKHLKI